MNLDYDRPQRLRFAPSPTGSLHVGGARTALFNYLLARRTKGRFVLRIEDTDVERNRPETEQMVMEELRWLGIVWDEGPDIGGPLGPYRQSERVDIYRKHAERLRSAGLAYDDEGALRFRIPPGRTIVEDAVKGTIAFENATFPDPVILKSSGGPTYNFAASVDDALMQITLVLRGDEHLPNTPVQIMLMRALDLQVPRYAHVPLILNEQHQKLSKRHDTVGIEEFRRQGIRPEAMIEHLALLGWSSADSREEFTLDELTTMFSLERVHKGGAIFNEGRLRAFNARALRKLPPGVLAEMIGSALERWGVPAAADPEEERRWIARFVEAYGEEIQTIEQARPLAEALHADEVSIPPREREKLDAPAVARLLEAFAEYVGSAPDLQNLPVSREIPALGERFGVGKKDAYHAVRVALTGEAHGPPLTLLLPLLGRERALERTHSAAGNRRERP